MTSRTPRIMLMLLAAMLSVLLSGGAFAVATATTTVLTANPSPALVDQNVTLTATVTGSSPTGTVTFYKENGATLGNSTLNASGVATFTYAFSNEGNRSLTARYHGNASNTGSTSAVLTLTVATTTTTTVLTASPSPALVDQNVTLTATVTGSSPTGTVTFYKENGATLGNSTLNASGVATFTYAFSNEGNRSLTARYNGNASNTASTSAVVTLVVNPKATTTITLTANPNPAGENQDVLLTAIVTGNAPTGTVAFRSGSSTLGNGAINAFGIATLTTSFSNRGTRLLTAIYSGDVGNQISSSAEVGLVVNAKASSTTTLAAAPNPGIKGQAVTLTATLTGNQPNGTVTFKNGSATLGTGNTTDSSGIVTLKTSFSMVGSYSLTAAYGGDSANEASTSVAMPFTVNRIPSSTTLGFNPNPAMIDEDVELIATVVGSGPQPTGTVTFREGGVKLGTATLDSHGVALIRKSFGAAGDHSFTASYGGDDNIAASDSAATVLTVNRILTSTRLSVERDSPPYNVLLGETMTLRAEVDLPSGMRTGPTGTVTFMDGDVILGSVNVSPYYSTTGIALLDTSLAAVGNRSITARYNGDTRNLASLSSAEVVMVGKAYSSTALTVNPNPVRADQNVTLTATVTSAAPASLAPTGTVTFKRFASSTILGVGTIDASSGVATFTGPILSTGFYPIVAYYDGDASNASSDSYPPVHLTVDKAISSTALIVSTNHVTVGDSVTLTATVTGAAPTSTVTFVDGDSTLGTSMIDQLSVDQLSGIATFTGSLPRAGSRTLTAGYSGDSDNTASTSTGVAVAVDQAVSSTTLSISPNPAIAGEVVTLTATVVGYKPSGTVTFQVGSITRTATLILGKATFSGALSEPGQQAITVSYGGDANNTASSSTMPLTVEPGICP